jgi:hypothetical protein
MNIIYNSLLNTKFKGFFGNKIASFPDVLHPVYVRLSDIIKSKSTLDARFVYFELIEAVIKPILILKQKSFFIRKETLDWLNSIVNESLFVTKSPVVNFNQVSLGLNDASLNSVSSLGPASGPIPDVSNSQPLSRRLHSSVEGSSMASAFGLFSSRSTQPVAIPGIPYEEHYSASL